MEPVGLQAKSPDIIGRVSQILGIQGQMQGLQGQAAQVAMEQQKQRESAGVADVDLTNFVGDDGTIDLNKLASDADVRRKAGSRHLELLSNAAGLKAQQIEAKQKLFALKEQQLEGLNSFVSSLRGDPDIAADNDKGRQKVNDQLVRYLSTHGRDVEGVVGDLASDLNDVPRGSLDKALSIFQRQAMDASTARASTLPQLANTGGSLRNINPDANPNSPMDIPLTLPPGEQDVVQMDQLGNPYRVQRTPRGAIAGTTALPGAGGGSPAVFGPGERASLESQAQTNFQNVDANRKAASMAPQQLDQIDKALALSEQVSTGGAWGAKRAQIESNIGSLIPGFQGMDDAAKMQELEKFTERIASDASKVLGVNARTDAERESIHKQNANTGYTPKAIQAVLKYAKAQTLAMQAKGDAQEAWLQKEGNGITKQHEFETQFRKAYDPRVFQFEVMTPEEQDKYWKSLSKEDRKELQNKTRALMDLGAIPNG